MSVLDYIDVGTYIYQKLNEEKEEKWIIKDIKRKEIMIQNDKGKKYKMCDRELEALYRQRRVRISRKGE